MNPESEADSFIPTRPAAYVQEFINAHPESLWTESLAFLADNYPALQEGQVQWLLEGGAAIKLLNPSRSKPSDIDILTINDQMVKDFRNARGFDVKNISQWLTLRHLKATESHQQLLLQYPTFIEFQQRSIPILNPTALAASKLISTHPNIPRRPQDLEDLSLLGADQDQISQFLRQIKE